MDEAKLQRGINVVDDAKSAYESQSIAVATVVRDTTLDREIAKEFERLSEATNRFRDSVAMLTRSHANE